MNTNYDFSCARCSASLQGVALDGECPSCHTAVANFLKTSVIDRDTREITEDLICRTCEYNLRGLCADSRCPECGVPITQSLSTNALRFSDYKWLRFMRRGTVLMITGVVGSLASLVFGILGIIGSGFPFYPIAGFAFVFYVVSAAGSTRLTLAEPCTGKSCRLSVLGIFAQLAVYLPILFFVIALWAYWLVVFCLFIPICASVGYTLAFVNIRRIGCRIGESTLTRMTTSTIRYLILGMTSGLSCNVLITLTVFPGNYFVWSSVQSLIIVLSILAGLFYLLSFIYAMISLGKFSDLLREAIHDLPEYPTEDGQLNQEV